MEIRKLDSSRSVRSQDIYNTLDLNRETSTDCFYIPLLNYSCREEKGLWFGTSFYTSTLTMDVD